jgi:hypothetical protein
VVAHHCEIPDCDTLVGVASTTRAEIAEFIAAANPAAILALLDHVDKLETLLREARRFAEHILNTSREKDDFQRWLKSGVVMDESCEVIEAIDGAIGKSTP